MTAQKTISRFFHDSPEDNKQVLLWQARRQKTGYSVTTQNAISRFFHDCPGDNKQVLP